jgi:CheY-like chemotaxis protein
MSTARILVVEDFEPFRRTVCSLVQGAGFEVVEAGDGLEAVEKARELQPDAILIDLGLPKLNGMDAARRIRSFALHSKLLFVSQETDSDVVRETFRLGGRAFVHKSRASNSLLPAIQAALAGSRFLSNGQQFNRDADDYHSHQALFYSDDAAFLEGTTRFVAESLSVADAVVVLATKSHREGLSESLRAADCDIDRAIQQGSYFSFDAAETLSAIMVDGMPDTVRFSARLNGMMESIAGQAQTQHPRVAIFGECVGLLYDEGNPDAAVRLEKVGNDLLKKHNVNILCAYPRPHSHESDHAFRNVCAEHSTVYWR